MGQAFDRDGNVLGEATGDSKKEVFDKLTAEFKNAHEIRIKSAEQGERDTIAGRAGQMETAPTDRMLQFFVFEHLPAHLQDVSKPFAGLAQRIVDGLPSNPERTVALRKLLEAKDCAVRALLYK